MSSRGRKNRRDSQFGRMNGTYWQSDAYNQIVFNALRAQTIALALNRFEYIGLPSTCDVRYLEMQLLFTGSATIAKPRDSPMENWYTLQACPIGALNMYGNPTKWRAMGDNGTSFEVVNEVNGLYIWDNMFRYPIMQQLDMWCRELTDVMRTKQVNRTLIKCPIVIECPQEMEQQAINLYKQIAGGEPAVIVTKGIESIRLTVHQTGAQYYGDELTAEERNIWSRIYLALGIDNATEKAERMVAEEIKSYKAPTEVQRMDFLNCRRRAFDRFNELFGYDVKVVQSEDTFSDTYNYQRDLMKIANDSTITIDLGDDGNVPAN